MLYQVKRTNQDGNVYQVLKRGETSINTDDNVSHKVYGVLKVEGENFETSTVKWVEMSEEIYLADEEELLEDVAMTDFWGVAETC